MTTSKIKIKLGAIEIEYEGSETFLKEELPALLSAVADLYQHSHSTVGPTTIEESASPPQNGALNGAASSGNPMLGTTNSLAARLQVKSGPELILAGAARLTLVENLASFPRQRLIDEIKSAAQYFKANHLSNLTKNLHSLVKDGKLNEPSKGHFALTASCKADLEARLA